MQWLRNMSKLTATKARREPGRLILARIRIHWKDSRQAAQQRWSQEESAPRWPLSGGHKGRGGGTGPSRPPTKLPIGTAGASRPPATEHNGCGACVQMTQPTQYGPISRGHSSPWGGCSMHRGRCCSHPQLAQLTPRLASANNFVAHDGVSKRRLSVAARRPITMT